MGGSSHAGLLFVTETYKTDTFALNHIAGFGDGDTHQTVDGINADIL